MDTNNLLFASNPLKLVATSTAASNLSIPIGAKEGDLLIVVEMEHDNGSTTTPGTTTSALPDIGGAALSPIGDGGSLGLYDNAGGSDDISCSFSYKILTSTDITTGAITNGCSSGDSSIRAGYLFSINRPITAVTTQTTLGNGTFLLENIETSSSALQTVTVNGNPRVSSINLSLAILVEGLTPVLSTTMQNAQALPNLDVSPYRVSGYYSKDNLTSFTNTFTSQTLIFQVNALLDIS